MEDQLQYLFENHNEFAALPTYIIGPALQATIAEIGEWPGELFPFLFLFIVLIYENSAY